jgi:hypothetical protein
VVRPFGRRGCVTLVSCFVARASVNKKKGL